MLIYKIFRAPEWAELDREGTTRGAPVDRNDGFVHFSTAAQLRETAARHFGGEADLRLLACDATAMGDDLRWEVSRGGDRFPHLYRALKRDDVRWHQALPLGETGHVFPDDIP